MARGKKWKFIIIFHLVILNAFIKSLPIQNASPSLISVDGSFPKLELPEVNSEDITIVEVDSDFGKEAIATEEYIPNNFKKQSNEIINLHSKHNVANDIQNTTGLVIERHYADTQEVRNSTNPIRNITRNSFIREIRPGQEAGRYAVEITIEDGTFRGKAIISVRLDADTREDPIVFHAEDLNIDSVSVGIGSQDNAVGTDYWAGDGILEIFPGTPALNYFVIVEYSGQINNFGRGIFQGNFQDSSYMGMNLHPTNARRVFPCIDEPSETTFISFSFNDVPFNNIVANSQPEEGSTNEFRVLQGPPHLWGMMAHNFVNINIPIANVLLFGRSGLRNQDSQASVAINNYFTALEEWTNKPYSEIILNQDGRMMIFALPDTSTDWYALSTVAIWEPYVFMELDHSVRQRKNALVKIAEAMTRQWIGYVFYPDNWRSQWIFNGLGTYAAYEIAKNFQDNPLGIDITLVDMNTIFVTDVIQESLLIDGYSNSEPLQPDEDIFDENAIRAHINGLLKYKAPAVMRMLRIVLGDENDDFIQSAVRNLINTIALQAVHHLNFYDAINGEWLFSENRVIGDVAEFVEPWIMNRGYPVVHIGLRQGGVIVTQEYFSFSPSPQIDFPVPLTFTTSISPNFETENLHNILMLDGTITIPMALNDQDFVLFNIQGQGYYRVNYDNDLWERIIECLQDPERREIIHPLNRATLVDDALNLARAGKLEYDIAFRVVLTMEHEKEYAPWAAFVRNMNFIMTRLMPFVSDDEERDPDIYLRMVRRTVGMVENEIGFYPDPLVNEPAMDSLTRGLVMEHACKAGYAPCIAAAVDWFYDPNNAEPTVNPDIPAEIRPAVYCTMVREGDDQVIEALQARLEIEESIYERIVILESLACSRDDGFIGSLLQDTIADDSPYGVEEKAKIFAAVVRSGHDNVGVAMNFMSMRTMDIRNRYGGAAKLEELIAVLAEHIAGGLDFDFSIWVDSVNSNLADSEDLAKRHRDRVNENVQWDQSHLEQVYEWIDENDAPTLVVSLVLISVSLLVALFNH